MEGLKQEQTCAALLGVWRPTPAPVTAMGALGVPAAAAPVRWSVCVAGSVLTVLLDVLQFDH